MINLSLAQKVKRLLLSELSDKPDNISDKIVAIIGQTQSWFRGENAQSPRQDREGDGLARWLEKPAFGQAIYGDRAEAKDIGRFLPAEGQLWQGTARVISRFHTVTLSQATATFMDAAKRLSCPTFSSAFRSGHALSLCDDRVG